MNVKNIIRFTPETKIIANQVKMINIVWPMSGCKISSNIIGIRINELRK